MSEKENETESVTERGTAQKGIEKEIGTETERRAGLREMWSMPPSGDQVSERFSFVFILRVSTTYMCFKKILPKSVFVRYRTQLD